MSKVNRCAAHVLSDDVGDLDVRFMALTTILPCVVWETDPTGRVRFVSNLVLEFLGRHPVELIGQPFPAVFSDRSWTLNAQVHTDGQVARGDGSWASMYQARTHRDETLYCRVEGRRCFDPLSGEFSGSIGTAEFVPQASLRQAAAAGLWEALVRGMLGVVLMNDQGTIRFANPMFQRALGLREAPPRGARLSQFLQVPSEAQTTDVGPGIWHEFKALPRDDADRPLSVLFGTPRGDGRYQLAVVLDDSARRVAAAMLRDEAPRADAILTQYAESLLSGFHDLWSEVVGALDSGPPAGEAAPAPAGAPPPKAALPSLTRRQTEVLELLARGQTNKEIGRALGISEATVKTHVRVLVEALGAANRTSAAVVAARLFHDAS
ncbi:LuxR C-terminal-related transcriptional regulator [Roseospira marina]|nr:LuxR C-terminal-related transcriptional regulator [Roseospira marina]MBB4314287.1 DNA-binding CsgD family transcriptional regulator/PAS domain-containing protein [Roseospira marina]MBB5087447.1 DNA-binding CsgD family transcriptional regulator/PAS domain-containing protein [Roseospira marina]